MVNMSSEEIKISEVTNPKIRPSRDQKNIEEWKKIPELSDWLDRSESNRSKAFCIFCNVELVARLDTLKKHGNTEKHHKSKIFTCPEQISDLEKNVLKCGIILSAMIAEQDLPKSLIDTMIPFLKKILPESQIMEKVSLNRDKVQEIVNRILASARKSKLRHILRNQNFSLIVD